MPSSSAGGKGVIPVRKVHHPVFVHNQKRFAVGFNQARFTKPFQEIPDSGPCGPNHRGQFLVRHSTVKMQLARGPLAQLSGELQDDGRQPLLAALDRFAQPALAIGERLVAEQQLGRIHDEVGCDLRGSGGTVSKPMRTQTFTSASDGRTISRLCSHLSGGRPTRPSRWFRKP